MTATPARPYSPSAPRARPRALGDVLALAVLPLVAVAVLPAAFAGGGTRRWFGGRAESQRAEAQAAKDAAAAAFYELDTAQRDLRISIETITAVDDSPAARRAVADFEAVGRRIDEASHQYIQAVDAHDLDRDDLEASAATQARGELTRAKDELVRVKGELDRFTDGLGPLLGKAETQLARLAPAVERARQSLLAASNALDAVRETGLRADDLAARLAALAPELTKLNQGAGQHGVPGTLERAERVSREAQAVRVEADRLPERAAEIDHRLVSLRTRAQALTTRSGQVEPILSELRRRFTAACWQDLQHVPDDSVEHVRQAEAKLAEAQSARDAQRWPDATALLSTARALLNSTDEAVSAAGDRLTRLNAVQKDPRQEIERTRFAIRDAQRLAMAGRHTPDPRDARPLDEAVARLERAIATLEGRHPDYWHFLTETEAVRHTVSDVVNRIREDRGAGH
ncbi:septation ring formation regulator EzrA [Streptomyces phaeoluteigriseus]|uniref:Septation ring formation regulator EzrA n=1 Tax=Streptomyces phaeoluteigriseus TaxID=114686 RepID=A0ABY4ZGE1_9ACTN|nr:septation ring formation regulator EzrA [Streptomyces phaeoluteigriseus]USQ88059.1 septation ring formation regulator EzrA [Streptomyces phaeoluteigriseus]